MTMTSPTTRVTKPKSISNDFEVTGSPSLQNYRRQQQYHRQLCLQPSLETGVISHLVWGACSELVQTRSDVVRLQRNPYSVFYAERALGVW